MQLKNEWLPKPKPEIYESFAINNDEIKIYVGSWTVTTNTGHTIRMTYDDTVSVATTTITV